MEGAVDPTHQGAVDHSDHRKRRFKPRPTRIEAVPVSDQTTDKGSRDKPIELMKLNTRNIFDR